MEKPLILMLEHDNDDRLITRSCFDEFRQEIKIDFVSGSDELMHYLSEMDQGKRDCPALILLTSMAAPMDALDILKTIKTNDVYGHIPVVMLSGIKDDKIIRESYALGASSFIQKPDSIKETADKIKSFIHYWFDTVELV